MGRWAGDGVLGLVVAWAMPAVSAVSPVFATATAALAASLSACLTGSIALISTFATEVATILAEQISFGSGVSGQTAPMPTGVGH